MDSSNLIAMWKAIQQQMISAWHVLAHDWIERITGWKPVPRFVSARSNNFLVDNPGFIFACISVHLRSSAARYYSHTNEYSSSETKGFVR